MFSGESEEVINSDGEWRLLELTKGTGLTHTLESSFMLCIVVISLDSSSTLTLSPRMTHNLAARLFWNREGQSQLLRVVSPAADAFGKMLVRLDSAIGF